MVARMKRRYGLCLRKALQPLLAPALTSGSAMVSKTYPPSGMYGVGEQLIKCQKGICHPELVSGSHKEIPNRVRNDKKVKAAFTLAEVLITLGIIGVVAAMTIPTLVQKYQEKAWSTSAQVFERKLEEALKTMNTQRTLAGYKNTSDFVSELGKYFKITKVCKNDDLLSCFEDTVVWGDEEVDMSKIKNSSHFGQKDWDTEVIGVHFGNGTTGLVAYNPECKEDLFTNQFTGTSCLALLYDTSGYKNPNTQSKDLRGINVLSLGGSNCAFEIAGTCFTAPFWPTPHVWNACDISGNTSDPDDLAFMSKYGLRYCLRPDLGKNDYWAGAVEACGGVSKMPTMAQVAEIANYVYNTTGIGAQTDKSGSTLDYDKVAELGFTASSGSSFYVWSGQEFSSNSAYARNFFPAHTLWNYYNRFYDFLQAVCLAD